MQLKRLKSIYGIHVNTFNETIRGPYEGRSLLDKSLGQVPYALHKKGIRRELRIHIIEKLINPAYHIMNNEDYSSFKNLGCSKDFKTVQVRERYRMALW